MAVVRARVERAKRAEGAERPERARMLTPIPEHDPHRTASAQSDVHGVRWSALLASRRESRHVRPRRVATSEPRCDAGVTGNLEVTQRGAPDLGGRIDQHERDDAVVGVGSGVGVTPCPQDGQKAIEADVGPALTEPAVGAGACAPRSQAAAKSTRPAAATRMPPQT
jgi:hypothetical protein